EPLTPAPGIEGTNYTNNINIPFIGPIIAAQITTALVEQGTQVAHDIGDFTIEVPTVAEIETAIGDFFHKDLEARDFVAVWTPEATGEIFNVDNVAVRVLADALVIALKAGGGADINAMTNFIPNDREFAIGVSGDRVQTLID